MEIITGRTGTAHVLAIDDAEINKMILGTAEIVLPTSLKLAAEMNGTNECRIKSGSLLMQGRLAKTRASEGYTAVPIENGTVGYYREDIIVAKYYTTTETTTDTGGNQITWTKEHIDLVAVKGTPSTTAYVAPTITTGDIDSGEIHMMKLWGVKLNGVNFDSLVDFRVMATGTALDLVTSAMQDLPAIAIQAETDINATANSAKSEITTAKNTAIAEVVAAGGVDAYSKAQTDTLIAGFKNITWSTVSVPVASWDTTALTATVAAAGMTSDTTTSAAIVSYLPSDKDNFTAAGIYGSGQGADTVTLTCTAVPTVAVSVNIGVAH